MPENASFEETYGVASAGNRDITSDNIWVQNAGLSPVPSYNFMLRVEALMDLPCKSIKAFSKEMEYELIQEGGLNDYVHMKRKPISRPFYFEVERYIGVDYVDPLPLGAELLLPVMLIVSRNAGQFYPLASARTYIFTGCTVTKKTYGEMSADQSGLFLETTTIAYREMVCMDGPWSEAVPYDPGDPNPKRSVMESRAAQINELARAEAEEKAEENRAADAKRQKERNDRVENDRTAREGEQPLVDIGEPPVDSGQGEQDKPPTEGETPPVDSGQGEQDEPSTDAEDAAQRARDAREQADRDAREQAEKAAQAQRNEDIAEQQERDAREQADRAAREAEQQAIEANEQAAGTAQTAPPETGSGPSDGGAQS